MHSLSRSLKIPLIIARSFIGGIDFHIRKSLSRGAYPAFMVFQVTQKCNSRCIMCNIWKKNTSKDLSTDEIKKFLSSGLFKSLKYANITGGEPFIRQDLPQIADEMVKNCPEIRNISISTNGYLTQKIADDVKKILKNLPDTVSLNVTVSIDGPKEIHNKIRGIPTAYDSAISTLEELSKIKDERFSLGVQTTVSKHNVHYLRETYNLAKNYCSRINITPVILSEGYFDNKDNESSLALSPDEKKEVLSFLGGISLAEPEHAYYYSKIRENTRKYPCTAFYKSVYMDASGNIYPCQYLSGFCAGNLPENNGEKLWFSGKANKLRKKLKSCSYCRTCFSNCDIISTMQDEFFDFAVFVARNPKIALALIKRIRGGGYGGGFI